MTLSKEELLKPRYKTIAEDTSGNLTVGVIFTQHNEGEWFWNELKTFEIPEHEIKAYPHLFKKLEWWEEREQVDMPKYVKDGYGRVGLLGKKYSQNLKNCVNVTFNNGNDVVAHLDNFQPATEEEYNTQSTQQ